MIRIKRDIYNSVKKYQQTIEALEHDQSISKKNRILILQFLRDAHLGKTLPYRQKKKISERACLRYLYGLKRIARIINKDFDKVTLENVEAFIEGLEDNTITKKNKLPYSRQTKKDFNIILKKFYKWYKGNNKVYPKIVNWLDTSYISSSYIAITEEQIEKIIKALHNPIDKAFISVLFDLGARIEELLNIDISDITKSNTTYKINLRFSKTFSRTLPLDSSVPYLKLWLMIHPQKEEQLFPLSYNQCLRRLRNYGKQAIGIPITPQIIRHSKATQLAQLGVGRYQICEWMGWAMSSKMPDRYIRREGIDNEKTLEFIKQRQAKIEG